MNAHSEDFATPEDNEFLEFSLSESSKTVTGSRPIIDDHPTALFGFYGSMSCSVVVWWSRNFRMWSEDILIDWLFFSTDDILARPGFLKWIPY